MEAVIDGKSPDPIVAAAARHARQTTIDEETLTAVLKPGGR